MKMDVNYIQHEIELILSITDTTYRTVFEMSEYEGQLENLRSLDLSLPIDWAIYPKVDGDYSFVMVELVQGITTRCPLLAIQLVTTVLSELYPLALIYTPGYD